MKVTPFQPFGDDSEGAHGALEAEDRRQPDVAVGARSCPVTEAATASRAAHPRSTPTRHGAPPRRPSRRGPRLNALADARESVGERDPLPAISACKIRK